MSTVIPMLGLIRKLVEERAGGDNERRQRTLRDFGISKEEYW